MSILIDRELKNVMINQLDNIRSNQGLNDCWDKLLLEKQNMLW